jgi:hypothetical protein
MTPMIAFKTWSALDQWRNLHPTLRMIVAECLAMWPDAYMEVTRIADALVGSPESGVHITGPPHRAIDLRTNDMPAAVATTVEQVINTRWYYGNAVNPGQKCAMQHGEGANRHLHLQVRDSTAKRMIDSTPPLPGGGA